MRKKYARQFDETATRHYLPHMKAKTPLQILKTERHGKRFYVAMRLGSYVQHTYREVNSPDALAESVKYFKAQGRGTCSAPNEFGVAVCTVSRYGHVSYGCFEAIKID